MEQERGLKSKVLLDIIEGFFLLYSSFKCVRKFKLCVSPLVKRYQLMINNTIRISNRSLTYNATYLQVQPFQVQYKSIHVYVGFLSPNRKSFLLILTFMFPYWLVFVFRPVFIVFMIVIERNYRITIVSRMTNDLILG